VSPFGQFGLPVISQVWNAGATVAQTKRWKTADEIEKGFGEETPPSTNDEAGVPTLTTAR